MTALFGCLYTECSDPTVHQAHLEAVRNLSIFQAFVIEVVIFIYTLVRKNTNFPSRIFLKNSLEMEFKKQST